MLSHRSRHIARNTLLVAAAFGLAAAAGLVRNMIIGRRFGIGADLDAYYAAFKLPDLLFTIVAGGALATAFIPVFADFLAADDHRGAWRLASAITNLVVMAVAVLAALAALIAPWLVRKVIAPGFGPAEQTEAVGLMRVVLLSTLFFAISSVQSSALHGFKHFLLPALAPVAYPLGIAAGAVWLAPILGVRGLAWGAVIGSILHLAIKVPGLLRFGFQWRPVLDLNTTPVRRVLALMGPRILDLAVFHLTLIATTNLASRLGGGGVSAVEWGWDVMQLPETLIGTAFGLVAFPTLAELAARHDIAGLRQTLGETMRAVIVLTAPAAVGLILLGRPALALIYQRGAFDAAATAAVFATLRFFALGLVAHSCLELAARAFFAQQDTVTPLIIACGSAAFNILLGVGLMRLLGAGGLALANSLAVTVEVVVLLLLLRRRWGGVQARETARTLGRVLVGAGMMAVAMFIVMDWRQRAGQGLVASLIVGGGTGGIVYVGSMLLLGEKALGYLPAALLKPGA